MVSIARRRPHGKARPALERKPDQGITLVELVITISLLTLSVFIGFQTLLTISRREQLRQTMTETAGFIEGVRQAAMTHSTNCMVTLSSSAVLSTQENPARSPNRCIAMLTDSSAQTLDLKAVSNDPGLTVSTSPASTFGFSFRGTALQSSDAEILLKPSKLNGFSYCILITSPVGFIKTGSKESSTASCSYIK